jgi:hypothetical protein
MTRWCHSAAVKLAETYRPWLSGAFSGPRRLPKSREASTLAGGSPDIPRLCHGGAGVDR